MGAGRVLSALVLVLAALGAGCGGRATTDGRSDASVDTAGIDRVQVDAAEQSNVDAVGPVDGSMNLDVMDSARDATTPRDALDAMEVALSDAVERFDAGDVADARDAPDAVECGAGLTNCEGRCVNTTDDPQNCGSCGVQCCFGGTVPLCTFGVCNSPCDEIGWAPCGTDRCSCTDLFIDPFNCGACGHVCPTGAGCESGACVLAVMDAGSVDAEAGAADACPAVDVTEPIESSTCPSGKLLCGSQCVDVNTDPANCGLCGNACWAGQFCVSGYCISDCTAGETSCCQQPCGPCACVDLSSDPLNCGACGVTCSGPNPTCSFGACGNVDAGADVVDACAATLISCGGVCVDTSTDPSNCGSCGSSCPSTERCVSGRCRCSCASPNASCAGACVLPSSDPANCGGCGSACPSGSSCVAGACVTGCVSGRIDCNGACVDPSNDAMNCGGCGVICPPGFVCSLGVCC